MHSISRTLGLWWWILPSFTCLRRWIGADRRLWFVCLLMILRRLAAVVRHHNIRWWDRCATAWRIDSICLYYSIILWWVLLGCIMRWQPAKLIISTTASTTWLHQTRWRRIRSMISCPFVTITIFAPLHLSIAAFFQRVSHDDNDLMMMSSTSKPCNQFILLAWLYVGPVATHSQMSDDWPKAKAPLRWKLAMYWLVFTKNSLNGERSSPKIWVSILVGQIICELKRSPLNTGVCVATGQQRNPHPSLTSSIQLHPPQASIHHPQTNNKQWVTCRVHDNIISFCLRQLWGALHYYFMS